MGTTVGRPCRSGTRIESNKNAPPTPHHRRTRPCEAGRSELVQDARAVPIRLLMAMAYRVASRLPWRGRQMPEPGSRLVRDEDRPARIRRLGEHGIERNLGEPGYRAVTSGVNWPRHAAAMEDLDPLTAVWTDQVRHVLDAASTGSRASRTAASTRPASRRRIHGVVTRTTPSKRTDCRSVANGSPVPGGRSSTTTSDSPSRRA